MTVSDRADQTTAGVRWAGAMPGAWTYGLETAWQTGSVGGDDIAAWATHLQLSTPRLGPLGLRVTSELNVASGDADPTDGSRETFDQLFPTSHDKYGLADQVGWRNIRHLRFGGDVTPWAGWPVAVNYHTWWLAEAADALYSAPGAALALVRGGAASSHVGQEIDVQVSRRIARRITLAGGYAHIFTGGFLREATPGASYSAPYVMATYVLFGE